MAQGGEFAFVLFATATGEHLLGIETNAVLTAVVILSMVLTPFSVLLLRLMPAPKQSFDGVENVPDGLTGDVLVIGFGRFGQIAVQALIARKHKVSIIDTDTDMIRAAAAFGMKVYYGDGTRLDILRAAGASTADLILVCIDSKELSTRIVQLVKSEFPLAKVFARAFDRGHAIELIKADVDFQIRELFESSLLFGGEALKALGSDEDEVAEIIQGVRNRDRQRFEAQVVGGIQAGRDLLLSNAEEQAREGGRAGVPSEPVVAPEEEQAGA
jgi:glutathione-regulated potassium-efflux system protein KefB